MVNKTFKIGEYAIGGIIYVRINKDDVTIMCKDWDTKKVIYTETSNNQRLLMTTLLDWTSSYYADNVMDYITGNAKGILQ